MGAFRYGDPSSTAPKRGLCKASQHPRTQPFHTGMRLPPCLCEPGTTRFKQEVEKEIDSEVKSLHKGDYFGVEPLLERSSGVAVHHTTAVSVGQAEVLFVSYQRMRSHLHGFHQAKEMIRAAHCYPTDDSLRHEEDFCDDWTTYKERLTRPMYKRHNPLGGKGFRFGTSKINITTAPHVRPVTPVKTSPKRTRETGQKEVRAKTAR